MESEEGNNNHKCCRECCSECDFDTFSDMTDDTMGSFEEMEMEMDKTGDATDAGENTKLESKKENCGHYFSGCKIVSKCCNKVFGCRICHDSEIEDHQIDRYEIEEIVCNICKMRQPISNGCINKECDEYSKTFASYYCDICHLYSDNPKSEIYHCDKCNICRICGVGNKPSDFFHCDKCGGCIHKKHEKIHKCVTDGFKNDCCICLEGMFHSRDSIVILGCGHAIHNKCLNLSLGQNKYTCPLCRKMMISGDALEVLIQHYDNIIQLYPYEDDIKSKISCNDCEFKGEIKFHPMGLKCGGCGGYNTIKVG
jgi:RING finger/CHY zinc finger protein 1